MEIFTKILIDSTEDKTFTRPNLTSNGTMGGSSAACAVSSGAGTRTGYEPFRAFDSDTSSYWIDSSGSLSSSHAVWITFYNPIPVKLTKVVIKHYSGSYWTCKSGYIQGSNDNSSWTNLANLPNSASTQTITVNLTNDNHYKYYRFYATSCNYWNSGDGLWYAWCIANIGMTGTYEE